MKRKIYIGKTYLTKNGNLFTVKKVVQGNAIYSFQYKKGNAERRAIDESGNRIKISNLLKIVN